MSYNEMSEAINVLTGAVIHLQSVVQNLSHSVACENTFQGQCDKQMDNHQVPPNLLYPRNSIVCSFCGKVDHSVKECRHKRKYDGWQLATQGLEQGKQVKDIQNKKSVGSKEFSKCRLANDRMQGSPSKKQKQGKGIKLHRSSSRKCLKCNYGHPGQPCHRDTGGCFYCGKMGHFARVCRKKEADLKKRTTKESQQQPKLPH